MNKQICAECGTENEEQYVYCKNCGAPLKREEREEKRYEGGRVNYAPVHNTAEDFKGADFTADGIADIPRDEISAFIGQKAFKIWPKLSKMEITHSKASWCWPAAVLGFIFGPLGAALWFFYRKMYKPAALLSVLGAVIGVAVTVMTMGNTTIDMSAFLNSFTQGDFTGALNSVEATESVWSTVASFIEDASSIATCILCGLFGYHIYKEHCVKKIHAFRAMQADSRYYSFGLASIGGVSGGMLALGILIMLAVNYLQSFILTLSSLIG